MKKSPAWKKNQWESSAEGGIYIGPTQGKSSPKNNRRACLCLDGKTYSRKCCDGNLINQGIGTIQGTGGERGAFSDGYSDGFDI
jgi:hypothetical protein